MISTERDFEYLTLEQAKALKSDSERDFALRCLAVGCLLVHQIPVGSSVIDFLVINPKRYIDSAIEPRGKLVEVTYFNKVSRSHRKSTQKKNTGTKEKKNRHKYQETKARKNRQIEAMKASGYPWTILYSEQLTNIKRAARAKR